MIPCVVKYNISARSAEFKCGFIEIPSSTAKIIESCCICDGSTINDRSDQRKSFLLVNNMTAREQTPRNAKQ